MLLLKERITRILQELHGYMYSQTVPVTHYKMTEATFKGGNRLDIDDRSWDDFSITDRWGGYDKNFWFRTTVQIPTSFAGKPVVYEVITGRESFWDNINPQFKLYINGTLTQGLDHNHREVVITECAKGGESIQIALHAHSGLDDVMVELKTKISTLERSIENLYYNIKVPLEALMALHDTDKRKADVLSILNHAVNILDLRKPHSKEFYDSIEEANRFVEEKIYSGDLWHEGTSALAIGHTHIDVAWRWTVDQTRDKVVRSFSTAINMMKEYPDYVFMSSQPQLYQFVKEEEPALYEEIKKKVREGRWEPEGAMWVEPDCNLISGESMVRQLLMGTRFFEKEFGVQNKIHWMPDVFGYSAALPQILKKAGVTYFVTSKISWNEYNKMPYDTFTWKGIDGTEILTHFMTARDYSQEPNNATGDFGTVYGGMLTPSQTSGAWQRYQQKDLNDEILFPYGFGDGGGGPTKEMLENGKRLAKGVPGCPKVKMGKSLDFFKKLEQDVTGHPRLPKWVGELYLEYHRGTYTSRGKNKKDNRRAEFLYEDIEWLSSMGKLVEKDFVYPKDELHKGWELILLNQFHDILPGCSIPQVYETSDKQYAEVFAQGNNMMQQAMNTVASKIQLEEKSVVVFNSLGFMRSDVVKIEVPTEFDCVQVYTIDGNKVVTQSITEMHDGVKQDFILFLAENIPAKGYSTFILRHEKIEEVKSSMEVSIERLANQFIDIVVDEEGNISSLYDKVNKREVLMAGTRGNVLQAFEDKPIIFDSWDINKYYSEKMWEVNDVESIHVIEHGPIRSGIQVNKRFGDSVIRQNMYIYNHTSRIDFQTHVDWNERQILLKTAFPIDVNTDKATYEIQYGNVERATHSNTSWDAAKFEVCAHKWVDVSEDDYGISLLNDCKYGHDIQDTVMRLTLLKSGQYPMPDADKGNHTFTYSIYPHSGDYRQAGTVQEAYKLNCPFYVKIEDAHEGTLQPTYSMVHVDQPNVIVEVVKKAEDSEDIIVRLYECFKRRSRVTLTFGQSLQEVTECNLLENEEMAVMDVDGNTFTFEIKPFEIKTFRLRVK